MYESYKKARNLSWKVLLECQIQALPIPLETIAKHYGIHVIPYSKFPLTQLFSPDVISGDGFITSIENQKYIILNDKKENRLRRRFTVAHELGHAILEHDSSIIFYRNSEIDDQSNLQEFEANIFARDLLMPSTVLASLNVQTPQEIVELCDISYTSASIRAKRLKLLYARQKFNLHSLEQRVNHQFTDFIQHYQK